MSIIQIVFSVIGILILLAIIRAIAEQIKFASCSHDNETRTSCGHYCCGDIWTCSSCELKTTDCSLTGLRKRSSR